MSNNTVSNSYKDNTISIQITVVDTPGFGVGLEEEEHTIDGLVNFLKEDLKYVNAFVIAFKQMDYRPTTAFKTMIKIVDGIFGEEFWDRVIIEATFWGYSEEKIEERDLTEDTSKCIKIVNCGEFIH